MECPKDLKLGREFLIQRREIDTKAKSSNSMFGTTTLKKRPVVKKASRFDAFKKNKDSNEQINGDNQD